MVRVFVSFSGSGGKEGYDQTVYCSRGSLARGRVPCSAR